MSKSQNDLVNQSSGSMLNQKTYEDYNKEKPNHNDPNFKNRSQNPNAKNMGSDDQETSVKEMTIYTCTMHSEVKSDKPGKCPKCGMELIEKN
jgi:hypothetical protein